MIVVFGSLNIDMVFHVPKLPQPGQTVLGQTYRLAEVLGKDPNCQVKGAGNVPKHLPQEALPVCRVHKTQAFADGLIVGRCHVGQFPNAAVRTA